ncbi:MAG: xanthine dehydrogenase accessory protein XdhC [Litoreibacter sp.]|nr:xanthine dehydrogenase accessory protein XdhC [Litoreibacter sp.]
MSFDLATLSRIVAHHGTVARVVVADIAGSVPRETGASMFVWAAGQSGTIGGGALEWDAVQTARRMLAEPGAAQVAKVPLGPALGQCCGGAVSLVTEVFAAGQVDAIPEGELAFARAITGAGPQPLSVTRTLSAARSSGATIETRLDKGWLIEPFATETTPLWIFGAGHVGRALVDVLAPLPDFAITWIDTAPERFPEDPPDGVTILPAAQPADAVRHAPQNAHHLVLTYSHALDLELCHGLLGHGFASVGLIGSATKWARFRKRLSDLGHSDAQIRRITCPIGDPALGKHPQAIAIGVANHLISALRQTSQHKDIAL